MFTDNVVILLYMLSYVRAKIKVLTSVGLAKLRFFWLILFSKILLFILI
jgi:hypothetical protein